jgi:hypothetical protein
MEKLEKRSDENLLLHVFGFMGLSCFTICAIISLIIGLGWLLSDSVWAFNGTLDWIDTAIPIMLIIWGLFPFIAFILLYKRFRESS